MKKLLIIFEIFTLCCFCACGKENITDVSEIVNSDKADNGVNLADINLDNGEEENDLDAGNRTMIAEALGIEEDSRNIRFILNSMNTIGAGQIQKAEAVEENGEKMIDIVAEDGTNYRIYLSGSGNVDAIENLLTGEWPITSDR